MEREKDFLSIMQSVDAFFPVGAFTLSNGLEDYVVKEKIRSSVELDEYMKGYLDIFPYQDLGIAALAYKNKDNMEFILKLDEVAQAIKSAFEIRKGSMKMCRRFIKVRQAIGDIPEELLRYNEKIEDQKGVVGK